MRELLKHPYNCDRRTKPPQTPMPEILQPAPEIRNRRGLFMVAFLFAGQGTRPPVRREEKGRKKVRVWVHQVSNQEPCGFEPGIPAGRALKSGGGRWGLEGDARRAGRHPPPSCLRRGECRRGGVGRIAGPYGVSHTGVKEDARSMPRRPPKKKLDGQNFFEAPVKPRRG